MSDTSTPVQQYRVRVLYDRDCSSPRDNDNVGTMACWHRRYKLGDVQPQVDPTDYLADLPADSLVLPLYLYDHSGITMSVAGFSDRWDSGQVGIIHVSPERIAQEWGTDPDARVKAEQCLRAEVEYYATYLEGQCYGYIIEEGETCDKGHVHWHEVDSCWGFIGSNPDDNGMLEHVDQQHHAALRKAFDNVEV